MIKVAVTASGGGVGQSILKSIAHAERLSAGGVKYSTVAIDPDPRAAGLYMADKGRLGPKLTDPEFVDKLIQICKEEGCKYLFPGFDAELPILAANKNKFLENGITPIISDPDVTELSDSKLSLIRFLEANGFPFIPTYNKEFPDVPGRYISKPERGCRSQNITTFTHNNISSLRPVLPGFIVQPFIEGTEYTCGTVSFGGNVLGVICMERELRNGDTYKARVNQNPIVLEFVCNLIGAIKPFGACNVQLRLRDNVPYVLEINARCSGTTAARTLAGFNEPRIILDYLEEGKVPKIRIEDGLEIYRYWEEVVVRPEKKVSK